MDLTDKKHKIKAAKTHKGRLHIQHRLPKIVEDPKKTVFFNSENSSEIMRIAMNEFYDSRKSFSLKLNKKNKIEPVFESSETIENLSEKNDASFFVYTSDSKKRPMNIVFGSLYEYKLLDSFEFEITNFIPSDYFKIKPQFDINSQPIIIFQGEKFETDNINERFKKFLLDFYAQDLLEEVNIPDLRKVIVFSIDQNNKIKIRNFQTQNPVGEYTIKTLSLEEVGPSFDLVPRRNHLCSEQDYKAACRQPKLSSENNRNKINSMLDVQGKLYTNRQNLEVVCLRKFDKIVGKKRKINEEALEILSKKDKKEENDNDISEDDQENDKDENDDIGEMKKEIKNEKSNSKNSKTFNKRNDSKFTNNLNKKIEKSNEKNKKITLNKSKKKQEEED